MILVHVSLSLSLSLSRIDTKRDRQLKRRLAVSGPYSGFSLFVDEARERLRGGNQPAGPMQAINISS
jgi:hypothetical protein